MANIKILVVDDDENICELLRLYLEKDGYDVQIALDGEAALEKFKHYNPDLILLDIMMPKKDGFHVLQEIRKTSDVPVIMITAKAESFDKLQSFDFGTDDYIVKPFDAKEVLARIKAILRRSTNAAEEKLRIEYDNLIIDKVSFEVRIKGKVVEMPPKELELLFHLASNPNKVYTRDQLLDEVWGFEYYGDSRTVDVHIKRLREKLDVVSPQWNLKTVWGVGYKFELRDPE
jgi:DNA-binding response OmpR family regulator